MQLLSLPIKQIPSKNYISQKFWCKTNVTALWIQALRWKSDIIIVTKNYIYSNIIAGPISR